MLEVTIKYNVSEREFGSWYAANAHQIVEHNWTAKEALNYFARAHGQAVEAIKQVANSPIPAAATSGVACKYCGRVLKDNHNLARHLKESCTYTKKTAGPAAKVLNC